MVKKKSNLLNWILLIVLLLLILGIIVQANSVTGNLTVPITLKGSSIKCGDNICDDPKESYNSCPEDCSMCGDGRCNTGSENFNSCPVDCPDPCGDGLCDTEFESYNTCSSDCAPLLPYCGDGLCDSPEHNNPNLDDGNYCPEDCNVQLA